WDSLVAKQPGKAMLIQETGLQRELTPDEIARRTPEQEAALFERKFALSFVQGSGAIEWLWNSNSYMTESNETPIGALHADGTEKPEATVLRDMAKFAAAASPYLVHPKRPAIAILTSQAAQFSVMGQFQIEAQQSAVRALAYGLHQPCYIIAENQIDKLGSPKLVILPSPQALRESTWQTLLTYVRNGGNLLVTGPVSRDEHWHLVDRYSPLGLHASTEPLTFHEATTIASTSAPDTFVSTTLSFAQQEQQALEFVRFNDGSVESQIPLGKGTLDWFAYPVELSTSSFDSAAVYNEAIRRSLIPFDATLKSTNGNGALIYPIDLEQGVLYVFESESATSQDINVKDGANHAVISFRLQPQHAALALLDKKTKQIIAKYGF
ncbi:MAG TPA: hypothetical protein VMH31_16730, partial [Methylomirabilota bacterium]|nr:hypothetical protein [Methylomirabilota bacterium]